nr:glycoside hydrolase family 28 protein [uncultured Lichenicoccus sp.]
MTITRRHLLGGAGAVIASPGAMAHAATTGGVHDVRQFGAAGNGRAIDSPAINRAIDDAASRGGGTVRLPAGTYLCFSIRLESGVTLLLESGATIRAAGVPRDGTQSGGFDAAESNAPWEAYQDFGHNHWHNSLIWGENLRDVAILGAGLIDGTALSRTYDWDQGLPLVRAPGVANKTIALKNCRDVTLRDFAILRGGHFGILATGVDNLVIDALRIDTNRDGMDIDCCRNVSISNCIVNSPEDDGICLKSSYALGHARITENVSITGCHVTGGYVVGTLLDGTFRCFDRINGGERAYTGRIKAGTESNGGYRNITVSGCTFETCRGFALETVDGGVCEDVTFTGNTMRDIRNAPPLYLRIGARMRGPAGVPVGTMRRILISDLVCQASSPMPSILAGLPGHAIEDVRIDNVLIRAPGGGTAAMASLQVPEDVKGYPEPRRMGMLPASGFFMRHVRNLEMSNVEIGFDALDARPVFVMDDVTGADLFRLFATGRGRAPAFSLSGVTGFSVSGSPGIPGRTVAESGRRTSF